MPDLFEIIAAYEQREPAPTVAVLTPLGTATALGERLVRELDALDPTARLSVLIDVVTSVAGCYALLESHPPMLDPEISAPLSID